MQPNITQMAQTAVAAIDARPTYVAPKNAPDPIAEDITRAKDMADAWKAYRGQLPKPLKVKSGQADPNAMSNRCEPIVTAGVAFLIGDDLSFSIEADENDTSIAGKDAEEQPSGQSQQDDDTPPKPSPARGKGETVAPANAQAQDYLDAFWLKNQKMSKLAKACINAGVFGHGFVKIIPGTDPTNPATPPRLVILNPQQVRICTMPGDVDTVLAFIVSYSVWDETSRTRREYRQVIERVDPDNDAAQWADSLDPDTTWLITDQTRTQTGSANTPWLTTDQNEWQHPFPPIFHWQNLPNPNEACGMPDLTADIIQANKDINFTQSNIQKILEWHASPLTYATGLRNTTLQRDPDVVLALPDGADLKNLEMASDLSSSLNFLATLRANMDEQSKVPAVALGRQSELPKGNLSGVALELLFMPLLQKTNMKRPLLGEALEQLCGAVLVLGGFQAEIGELEIITNWPQVLPHDPAADWQVAPVKNQMGVSKRTLLEENGYNFDEEQARNQDEQQQALTAFAQGNGLPPVSPLPTGDEDPQSQGDEDPAQTTPSGKPGPDPNHPAAVAARQRASVAMKAAFPPKAGK
jgi:hypothetical protein